MEERIDRERARWGDLDAVERNQQRKRIAQEEGRHKPGHTGAVSNEPALKRRERGVRPATLIAVQAIAAVLYDDPKWPRLPGSLAKRAAEKAQELGVPWANEVAPLNPTMRQIAKAFIDIVEKIDERRGALTVIDRHSPSRRVKS